MNSSCIGMKSSCVVDEYGKWRTDEDEDETELCRIINHSATFASLHFVHVRGHAGLEVNTITGAISGAWA